VSIVQLQTGTNDEQFATQFLVSVRLSATPIRYRGNECQPTHTHKKYGNDNSPAGRFSRNKYISFGNAQMILWRRPDLLATTSEQLGAGDGWRASGIQDL